MSVPATPVNGPAAAGAAVGAAGGASSAAHPGVVGAFEAVLGAMAGQIDAAGVVAQPGAQPGATGTATAAQPAAGATLAADLTGLPGLAKPAIAVSTGDAKGTKDEAKDSTLSGDALTDAQAALLAALGMGAPIIVPPAAAQPKGDGESQDAATGSRPGLSAADAALLAAGPKIATDGAPAGPAPLTNPKETLAKAAAVVPTPAEPVPAASAPTGAQLAATPASAPAQTIATDPAALLSQAAATPMPAAQPAPEPAAKTPRRTTATAAVGDTAAKPAATAMEAHADTPKVTAATATAGETAADKDAALTADPAARRDTAEAAPTPAPTQSRTAEAAASAPLTPAVALRGAPETVANLAAKIIKKLDERSTRFDLELDPAGLGRVDVRVEIGAHGRMTAAMSFDNPQAAAELRARSGELTKALEQSGFDMSGGLSFEFAGNGGQSQWGQDPQQSDTGAAFRGRAFQAALDTAGAADASADLIGGMGLRRQIASGVDVRI